MSGWLSVFNTRSFNATEDESSTNLNLPCVITAYDVVVATNNFSEAGLIIKDELFEIYRGVHENELVSVHRMLNVSQSEVKQKVLLMNSLNHPHISKVVAWNPDRSSILTHRMEYGCLEQRLQEGKLPFGDRFRMLWEVLSALRYLDSKGAPMYAFSSALIFLDKDDRCKFTYTMRKNRSEKQLVCSVGYLLVEILTGLPKDKIIDLVHLLQTKPNASSILTENLDQRVHKVWSIPLIGDIIGVTLSCLRVFKQRWKFKKLLAAIAAIAEKGKMDLNYDDKFSTQSCMTPTSPSPTRLTKIETNSVVKSPLFIPSEELSFATNNFSSGSIIGKGAFGVVYKGYYKGSEVAIKKLIPGNLRRSFQREAQLLYEINHPCVLSLIGFDPNGPCLVTKYMAGGSILSWLKGERGILMWEDKVRICQEMASAVAYMHSQGVVHRDLKPANVFLDEDKKSKICYMGLTKLFEGDYLAVSAWQGTRGYMDPHALTTGSLNLKSDTYALGLNILQLLTGIESIQDLHTLLGQMNHLNLERSLSKSSSSKYDVIWDVPSSSPSRWDRSDFCKVVEKVCAHLDYESNAMPKKVLHRVVGLVLRCVERTQDLRPSLGDSLLPALQELLAVRHLGRTGEGLSSAEVNASSRKVTGKSVISAEEYFRSASTGRVHSENFSAVTRDDPGDVSFGKDVEGEERSEKMNEGVDEGARDLKQEDESKISEVTNGLDAIGSAFEFDVRNKRERDEVDKGKKKENSDQDGKAFREEEATDDTDLMKGLSLDTLAPVITSVGSQLFAVHARASTLRENSQLVVQKRREATKKALDAATTVKHLEAQTSEAYEEENLAILSEQTENAEKAAKAAIAKAQEAEEEFDTILSSVQEAEKEEEAAEAKGVWLLENVKQKALVKARYEEDNMTARKTDLARLTAEQEALSLRKWAGQSELSEIDKEAEELHQKEKELTVTKNTNKEILEKNKNELEEQIAELRRQLAEKEKELAACEYMLEEVDQEFVTETTNLDERRAVLEKEAERVLAETMEAEAEAERLAEEKSRLEELHNQSELNVKMFMQVIADAGKLLEKLEMTAKSRSATSALATLRESIRQSAIRERTAVKDWQDMRQKAGELRASLEELSVSKTRLQLQMAMSQQTMASSDMAVILLQTEKKVAASSKNFKEAAQLAGAAKLRMDERREAEKRVQILKTELEEIIRKESAEASMAAELEVLLKDSEQNMAMVRCEWLRLVSAATRVEMKVALEGENMEKVEYLKREAAAADKEAETLWMDCGLQDHSFKDRTVEERNEKSWLEMDNGDSDEVFDGAESCEQSV